MIKCWKHDCRDLLIVKDEKESVELLLETQPVDPTSYNLGCPLCPHTHPISLNLMILNRFVRLTACFCLSLHFALSNSALLADATGDAKQILEQSGVSAGFVVHLGAGDGELTAALRRNDATQVHGLQRDPAVVVAARKRVQAAGHYSDFAIDVFDGTTTKPIDTHTLFALDGRLRPPPAKTVVDRDAVPVLLTIPLGGER